MIPLRMEEYRLVHLSDLHFTGRPLTELDSKFWKHFHMDSIAEANLQILLEDVVKINPHHIVITGDVTNTAHPVEFERAKTWLLQLQQQLSPSLPIGTTRLDPNLFTVVPGNHDVSRTPSTFAWLSRRKAETSRLKRFMDAFGSTLNAAGANVYDYDLVFPAHKVLFGAIDVFAINSTNDVPVHEVGFNATGEIGDTQRIRLAQALNEARVNEGRFRIVLCHHHPLVIPYHQESDLVEGFMVLRDARSFLRVCFDHGVHLVMHGHKHVPFIWTNEVIPELDPPHKMVVIAAGSPTHQRAGSSQVYNRYVALRRELGGVSTVERVEMFTRRYDPRAQGFKDVRGPIEVFSVHEPQERDDGVQERDDGFLR